MIPASPARTEVDYLAVGNPTVDLPPEGPAEIGGSVVYAAIQAARLGHSAVAVGRGRPADLEPLWKRFSPEASLRVQASGETTMFRNRTSDGIRTQWIRSSAGPIVDLASFDLPPAKVVHIAPVAGELDLATTAEAAGALKAGFVGMTPQGMVRHWDADGLVRLRALEAVTASAVRGVDAAVFADYEAPYLEKLIFALREAGTAVVVTSAHRGCEVLSRQDSQAFSAFPVERVVDETGAGDVFATAFFTGLESGLSVRKAVQLASAAAAVKIRAVGPDAVGHVDEIVELSASREL